jgi:hypothetical protein
VGADEVFVTSFPDAGPRYKVSEEGGTMPVWSADSRRLFYISGRRLLGATLRFTPDFAVVARDTLFEGEFDSRSDYHAMYDASPDGASFALLKRLDAEPQLLVVHNWTRELRDRRAAVRSRTAP